MPKFKINDLIFDGLRVWKITDINEANYKLIILGATYGPIEEPDKTYKLNQKHIDDVAKLWDEKLLKEHGRAFVLCEQCRKPIYEGEKYYYSYGDYYCSQECYLEKNDIPYGPLEKGDCTDIEYPVITWLNTNMEKTNGNI